MRYPLFIESDFAFPQFLHVAMRHPRPRIDDIEKAVTEALALVMQGADLKPGDRVAIGVGSRGIANLALMVRTLVAVLRRMGAVPFIVPAMGSHGGATAEGQEGVLARLGITEACCGAPIRPAMETVRVARVFEDVPVYFSSEALRAAHTISINRIKPHTKFKGELESGIAKMLCVGLGKHDGALVYHRFAIKHGFLPLLRAMAEELRVRTHFRGAIGIVENAYDETCRIEAVPAGRLFEKEETLLSLAKSHLPRLPFRELDVLVIRQIGKEISGAGMDPNVTGRAFDLMESDFADQLKVTRVAVLDLSELTGGNAIGMGNADIITEKVFDKLDYEVTLMNALTSLSLRKAFIPVRLPNDRKAIQAGFTTLGPVASRDVRAVIIQDTLNLTEFMASIALMQELADRPEAAILSRANLKFDAADNLIPPWDLET
ncbi:MAG: hypothetical protein JJV98_10270 [Desulfosarcina sp.]|nr:hypothetical protein [Desulfobacterales bacterium]